MRLSRFIIVLLLAQVVAITIATAQSHVSDTLHVYFKVGKTAIDTSFAGNNNTLKTFDKFLTDYNKTRFNYTLNGITLQGSASPEGKQRWNTILANRRADAIIKYLKNKYPSYQQIVQKDNIKLNLGANYREWAELRNTRIIVDYLRISKEPKLPAMKQLQIVKAESYLPAPPAIKEYEYTANAHTNSTKEKGNLRIAVKTNTLYDLLLTPNIGIEIPVLSNWSVAGNWMYAWWKADPNSWYHRIYGGDLEIRRWLGGQSDLTGWHIGAYAQMLTYDFELGNKGVLGEKWTYGGGLAVGWSKKLASRLNLDFTLGVGYLTGEYIEYEPIDNCYVWRATKNRNWIGPTKAEVSLVWLLGRW